MTLLNKILKYESHNSYLTKIQKKIRKKFKIYFVPTNIKNLPKNNHPIYTNFGYQEELIKTFSKKNHLISFNTHPKIVQILKKLFLNENLEFNFLDFGGENIDFYLYLKKNFRNIHYFVYNQKEINEDFSKVKEKYKFENITILNNVDEINSYKYDFVNFGSVIQYIENYDKILTKIITSSKKYIFFSGTHFYSKKLNEVNKIVVKQVNMLPDKLYCYFFNFEDFMKIFISNGFSVIFKEKNLTDNVNYKNFGLSYGNIEYTDLLISRK